MLDILCPDGALDVDEDPGGGVVQLDHDEGAPEPGLIAEGVEVAGETALRRVRHLGTTISSDTGCHIKLALSAKSGVRRLEVGESKLKYVDDRLQI